MSQPEDQPKPPENEAAPDAPKSSSDEPEEERVTHFSEEFKRFFARGLPDPQQWIGVGLDGTLAFCEGERFPETIGKPVPDMVARVLDWIDQGHTVKIFTPRAADDAGVAQVMEWLRAHDLPDIEVTCEKDLHMLEVWDSRAIQIIPNTGQPVGVSTVEQPRNTGGNNPMTSPRG